MAIVGVRTGPGVGAIFDIQVVTATKCGTVATESVYRIVVVPFQPQFLGTVTVRVIESEEERTVAGIVTVCTCKTNNIVPFTIGFMSFFVSN